MSNNPECLKQGYLVGLKWPLPTDIKTYHNDPTKIVGCNQLFCRRCQNPVRQWAGYRLGANRLLQMQDYKALYATQDPDTSPYLTKSMSGECFRVYACQCWADEVTAWYDLGVSYIEFDSWACNGHPQ